jgi:hypothetical protein
MEAPMKYLIPLLLFIPCAAIAEPQGRCDTAQKVHEYLNSDYGEIPFIEMKDNQDRQFIMYANPKTGSWTVLQLTDDKLCGISAGKEMIPATKRYETTEPNKKKDIPG